MPSDAAAGRHPADDRASTALNDSANSARKRRALSLADITWADTLAPAPEAPPMRDLLSADTGLRSAAFKYWVSETLQGRANMALNRLLSLLPPSVASQTGFWLSGFSMHRYRKRIFAKRIARNLRMLAPLSPHTPDEAALLRCWWGNTGRSVAEFSVANRIWPEGHVEVIGRETLEEAKATGKPLIFVSVHLASWEAQAAIMHQGLAGPTIGTFEPEGSRHSNRMIFDLRKRRNHVLLPPGPKSGRQVHGLITSGACNATIFIDEVRDRQTHLPAFGRPLPDKGNAAMIAKLANASGALLVPIYMVREDHAGGEKSPHFRLTILPPLAPAPGQEKGRTVPYPVADTIRRIDALFEPIVCAHLDQWYMLQELRLPDEWPEDHFR